MRERASIAAAFAALVFTSGSARAEVVPLAVLEERAVQKHALLAASAARTRAATADVAHARSAYRPRMGLTADANVAPGRQLLTVPRFEVREDGTVVAARGDTFRVQGARTLSQGADAFIPQVRTGADLSLGATLYDFGKTPALVAASRAKLRASKVDEELTRAQIVAGVRGAYLSWLSAHELHKLSTAGQDDAARRSARASALVQEGARPRGDLAPVEADRLLSQLERERAEGELEGARLLLEQSVGEPLAAQAEPDPGLLAVGLQDDRGAPDAEMRALDAQRATLLASAHAQRKVNAPVLSTSFSVGVHAQGREEWTAFPTYLAGLSLAVPLWDGGASNASSEAADARADEVRIRLEHAEVTRAQELARARLDVVHAERRADTAQQLLEICKTRLADVEAGYEMGAMQFEQVVQARALLRRAETELVMAKVARAEAVLRVSP
ncbi:MAG: TolC family protein [Polyangiales bacterium]